MTVRPMINAMADASRWQYRWGSAIDHRTLLPLSIEGVKKSRQLRLIKDIDKGKVQMGVLRLIARLNVNFHLSPFTSLSLSLSLSPYMRRIEKEPGLGPFFFNLAIVRI